MYENKFTMVDFENHKRKFAGALKEILGVTFWPYNKSFIDQACSVRMAGYWSPLLKRTGVLVGNFEKNP